MKKTFVSVVVPVYNVEPFLPECVESILAQTWQNYEVILVDDGFAGGSPHGLVRYYFRHGRYVQFRGVHHVHPAFQSAL